MPTCLYRVRPAGALAEGPSRELLGSIAKLVAGSEHAPRYESFFAIPLDVSPFAPDLLHELTTKLASLAEDFDLVLIDFAWPRISGQYARSEWLLANAIRGAATRTPSARFLILVEELPTPAEQLSAAAEELGDTSLELLDLAGRWRCAGASRTDLVRSLEGLLTDKRSALEGFERRFIRWRGVFRRPGSPRDRFFKFQYTLKGAIGTEELSELLIAYVEARDPSALIYADPADPGWLQPSVQETAHSTRRPYCTLADIESHLQGRLPYDDTTVLVEEVLEAATGSGRACLVLPAFRDGVSLAEAEATLLRAGIREPSVLSVLMDDQTRRTGDETTDGSQWFRTVQFDRGHARTSVDYFIACPIEPLDPDEWQVAAARSMGEVLEMSMDIAGHTRTGIWSLIGDYPEGLEHPPPDSRAAIDVYPSLARLDPFDARWLIYLLIGRIRTLLNCEPAQVLLIMPVEENATTPLLQAASTMERLAVIGLDRDQIEGHRPIAPEDRDTIQRFRQLRVVSVDEATAGGHTRHRIDTIVKEIRGRPLDAAASVLRAGNSRRADIDLFHWVPYAATGGLP